MIYPLYCINGTSFVDVFQKKTKTMRTGLLLISGYFINICTININCPLVDT